MKLQKFLIVATLSIAGCRAEQAEQAAQDTASWGKDAHAQRTTMGPVAVDRAAKLVREEYPFLMDDKAKKRWSIDDVKFGLFPNRDVGELAKIDGPIEAKVVKATKRREVLGSHFKTLSYLREHDGIAKANFRDAGITSDPIMILVDRDIDQLPPQLFVLVVFDNSALKNQQFWVPAASIRPLTGVPR
jgi:hypothetical protein